MKILYITRSRPQNSVNAVYTKGLKENGVDVEIVSVPEVGLLDLVKRLRRKGPDLIMVGYDGPLLVLAARFFSGRKVVYNALCSVYERLVVSRELVSKYSPKAFYYWLLDFLAVHFADLTMVETNEQINYFKKLFKISDKKIFRALTGVNEDDFFYESDIKKFPEFTVLFRGALMPEAGAEYVVKAAKLLEKDNVKFVMLSGGLLLNSIKKLILELKPNNLTLISGFLPQEKLRETMQKCHLSLGQLSDHERLDRTIPHKAYESLAMKLPYLTASNRGVAELFEDGRTCITCRPADATDLADKILWTKNNPEKLEKIAENGYNLLISEFASKKLARRFLIRLSQ